jgi:hypothetical protein
VRRERRRVTRFTSTKVQILTPAGRGRAWQEAQARAEGEASRAREQIAHISTQLEEGEHQHSSRASEFEREVRVFAYCRWRA